MLKVVPWWQLHSELANLFANAVMDLSKNEKREEETGSSRLLEKELRRVYKTFDNLYLWLGESQRRDRATWESKLYRVVSVRERQKVGQFYAWLGTDRS